MKANNSNTTRSSNVMSIARLHMLNPKVRKKNSASAIEVKTCKTKVKSKNIDASMHIWI